MPALIVCWATLRAPAGKLLAPMMPVLVPMLRRDGEDLNALLERLDKTIARFYADGEVTDEINGLLKTAREEADFASEQFMQWFIKEQVEEVATMSDLLAVVTRNRDDIEDIEEYVAREQRAGDTDPTAPRIAGA